jgi:hypothetical protein
MTGRTFQEIGIDILEQITGQRLRKLQNRIGWWRDH